MITNKEYQAVLDYIQSYWQIALVEANAKRFKKSGQNPFMKIGRIVLPKPFISPNHSYFAGTQFYWDSYFTILGLVADRQIELAKGMVDNLCFLQQKFGLIPARNSFTSWGRTQPPYLTRMAFEVYGHNRNDKEWMRKVMAAAQREYMQVWTTEQRFDAKSKLSRYKPKNFHKQLAVYESGWDRSTRFSLGSGILPVDLNCLLYQYETDFLRWAIECGDQTAQKRWQDALIDRKKQISQYFWNKKEGFFYDYNLTSNQLIKLKTLAGFYPMWCGAATKEQAEKCRAALEFFEEDGGLTCTEKLVYTGKQWDYPNGWAPLQWIVIEGLRRYGFEEDARRLTRKWLDCNVKVFKSTGKLWEKYDVANCAVGLPGRYPTQPGFAWTNSIFLRLVMVD